MAELLPISMLEDKAQSLGLQLVSSFGGRGDAIGKHFRTLPPKRPGLLPIKVSHGKQVPQHVTYGQNVATVGLT
jgi:hypothetical protein